MIGSVWLSWIDGSVMSESLVKFTTFFANEARLIRLGGAHFGSSAFCQNRL